MNHRIIWATGADAEPEITVEQKNSILNIAKRFDIKTETLVIVPEFGVASKGSPPAVMFSVGNLWFGVEPDGYAHT